IMQAALERWEPDPGVTRENRMVPGWDGDPEVRVRIYRPADQEGELPCLFWIHGGGHVLGQVEQDDPAMDFYVGSIGCVAVSVDWRLPPEHPYPAPMDDCYAGLAWTYENADELGIDANRIVVGGASSGGGSAAGLTLLARDRGEIPVAAQFLVYPMIDDRNVTPSSHLITHHKVWNRTSNIIGWRSYLGDLHGTDDVPAYAAPTRAEDLSGLPPTWMATADLDLFVDEDLDYARRLIDAGVPTELHVYPRAIHGFDVFAPDSAVSKRYVAERNAGLARLFAL
ncbi:MAG TPA: alpha/beta hydrolase, partial [Acidimicrobiia bacterium]|nr:alpha/beta hydrolase [Acidimicrobiia bacterium]